MLKKAIFPSCLIALSSVCLAEDYYLDATTMGVGATAGENLVVKEGCLNPNESSCSDKFKWLSSVSPVKIGNLQIIGQVSGDFEIVLTADFDNLIKGIKILTADNKGFGLAFSEGGTWGSYDFAPNGIGKGGAHYGDRLPGWSKTNFNELKITAQQGVANVYTNGTALKKAITFDANVVFERVAIEGITSKDRLIDVKVRGIQGAGSCSATPAPTPSTPTTPSGDCMASYLSGQLHVPCVAVSDPFGTTTVYDIKLQQQSGGFTFDLDMNSVKPR
ncbi:MAG TPA: hypothetical protein EYP59_02740 [Thiotrichaceae bacterium]|nr:hypothetical protein [Thiotrichaceae bacterium]